MGDFDGNDESWDTAPIARPVGDLNGDHEWGPSASTASAPRPPNRDRSAHLGAGRLSVRTSKLDEVGRAGAQRASVEFR